MKYKLFIACLFVVLASMLLLGFVVQRQSVQASSSRFAVTIIGGVVNAEKPSHITIATRPEVRVGMRVFYWCTHPDGMNRIVYPNAHANVLGRYTWAWSTGAPCAVGNAVVIVNARNKAKQTVVVQKTFPFGSFTPPTPTPTVMPTPASVNNNPWGFNFTLGRKITTPPTGFCNYFDCVPNFTSGTGYVVECVDLMYSLTGGRPNVCAGHGGEYRVLLSRLPIPLS